MAKTRSKTPTTKKTGTYVDGFVIPVPKKNLPAYLRMARLGAQVWMDHGALEYIECVGDDVPMGKWTSFPRAVKAKPAETVVFSWIVYRSKAARDRINAKAMHDPRMARFDPKNMPFDGKRMIFGGFRKKVAA